MIVWYAVLSNVSDLDGPVAITLIVSAAAVTLVILFVMNSRTHLLERSLRPATGDKVAVVSQLPTGPTQDEYADVLQG